MFRRLHISGALCIALLLNACGGLSTKSEPSPLRNEVMLTALAQIGKAYRYGAVGPDDFDCSGLIQYIYSISGISLPRSSHEQLHAGREIDYDEIQPGDLLFYRLSGWTGVDHVAVYLGDGRAVQAPSEGKNVIISNISTNYWRKHLVEVVNVID